MNHVLDFPILTDVPSKPHAVGASSTAVAAPSIKDATLAQFTRTEAALRLVAEKYRDVAFAVETSRGMADAKAAREDLRTNGRYAIQRAEKQVKDEVNDLKRAIADEAERLIAIVKPVEEAVHAQIVARESVLAAEKAERDRIEAERVAKHRAGIETIRGYVAQAQGKTAAQIERALAVVNVISIGTEWEEFQGEATSMVLSVTEALRGLHAATAARDAEAARIEAQRIEQARVAAEQAERQRHLDEQAAALRWQQEVIDAAATQSAHALGIHVAKGVPLDPPATSLGEAYDRADAIITAQNSQRQESGARTDPNTTGNGNMAHQTEHAAPLGGPAEGEGATALSPGSSSDAAGSRTDDAPPAGDTYLPASQCGPGLAFDSGEFVSATELAQWHRTDASGKVVEIVAVAMPFPHRTPTPSTIDALHQLRYAARNIIDALNEMSDGEGQLPIPEGPERDALMVAWSELCTALGATDGVAS